MPRVLTRFRNEETTLATRLVKIPEISPLAGEEIALNHNPMEAPAAHSPLRPLKQPSRLPRLRPGPTRTTGDLSFYRRILAYFADDKILLAVLIGLIWTSLFAGVLEGATVGALTDAVLSDHPRSDLAGRIVQAPFSGFGRSGRVIALALAWFFLRSTNETMTLFREMINNRLRYNGTARVRAQLFDHLQALSPAYHRSRPQGDAIYRVTTDAQGFFGVLDTFIGASNSALTVVVIGGVMAGFNLTITFVCLALAPLLVIANIYFGRTIRRTSADSKHVDTEFTTFVQRALATVSLSQLFGRQRTASRAFRSLIDRTITAGMSMNWQQQLYPLSQRLFYAVGHAFVLGYGAYLVLTTRHDAVEGFTVGGITAMLVYLGQLWEPIRRMTGFTADVQTNAAACARVFAVLDLTPTVVDAPAAEPLPLQPRTLTLDKVAFAYAPAPATPSIDAPIPAPPPRLILRSVSAHIAPGRLVAFVGPSGSGKSTLLNLLPRFYDPTAGSISLDGHELRTVRLSDVRAHIALVPQDSPVIAGTVAENIAFGRPSATLAEIHAAAELAGASRFIEELEHEYNTPITEGGQNLSGGQRQRLAIARAILTHAPILVLDEPTSGLDPHHEQLILQTLHTLKRHRTVILVTHSLSGVRDCDEIFVLKDGIVAEHGAHDQLLSQNGPYAALARATELQIAG